MVSPFYFLLGALSSPPVRLLYRLRASGQENLPRKRRLRPLGEPPLQSRPLAARAAAVAEAADPVHGEVRALPPAFAADSRARRGVPGSARRGRRRRRSRPRSSFAREGEGRRDLPGGDAPREGARQEAPARPHTGAARVALEAEVPLIPAAIAGTDRLTRLRAAAGGLRAADRAGRSRRPRMRKAARDGDRPADGRDRRAREHAVKPLLVVDGDSLAHRAYHALPKTIQAAPGGARPARSSASRTS